MKLVQKTERGMTLVELLAAVTILIIIIGSIMNFFPQLTIMNKTNEEKSQAISIAKEDLIKWQTDGKNFLAAGQIPGNVTKLSNISLSGKNYYHFQATKGVFLEDVYLKSNSDISANSYSNIPATDVTKAYFIEIELSNNKGTVITKTYGYVFSK